MICLMELDDGTIYWKTHGSDGKNQWFSVDVSLKPIHDMVICVFENTMFFPPSNLMDLHQREAVIVDRFLGWLVARCAS